MPRPPTTTPSPSFALALGAGGARGLVHIVVLEAFDELGLKPAIIAGASMGAVVGAAYAAGMNGREMRAYAIRILRERSEVMAALIASRVGRLTDVLAGFGNPFLIDGRGGLECGLSGGAREIGRRISNHLGSGRVRTIRQPPSKRDRRSPASARGCNTPGQPRLRPSAHIAART